MPHTNPFRPVANVRNLEAGSTACADRANQRPYYFQADFLPKPDRFGRLKKSWPTTVDPCLEGAALRKLFGMRFPTKPRTSYRLRALLLVRQHRPFHPVHRDLGFAWPYINSGDLLSLKAQPVLVQKDGISTQFWHSVMG